RCKCNDKGIVRDDVQGIGVGVPGPVNARGVVNGCVNLGWDVVDVKALLEELSGLPVEVGNDANVAALGEMWQGGGRGCENVLMVTLGTGVGGGVIVDGHIIAGAHGAGGEIGHMTVNPDEVSACNCGRCGCLEQYASATGIVRVAKAYLKDAGKALANQGAQQNQSVLYNMEDITAKDVFDAAKSGDEAAAAITDKVCGILGIALANIAVVADPEVIVLGGGVSKAGKYLADKVQKAFTGYAFRACRDTQVALAQLGNDAGIYGAVKLMIE
ncbi:MAG: ROK family glucokinase, partial [Clostridiales bacterium]|nr:ROK family glucokinase [Clostridiales bacterium]